MDCMSSCNAACTQLGVFWGPLVMTAVGFAVSAFVAWQKSRLVEVHRTEATQAKIENAKLSATTEVLKAQVESLRPPPPSSP